jgi:hypothetical protein
MVWNPQFHKWSKHITTCWHWVCEQVEEKIINIESCHDPQQTADILTKPLAHPKHMTHSKGMGLALACRGVLGNI